VEAGSPGQLAEHRLCRHRRVRLLLQLSAEPSRPRSDLQGSVRAAAGPHDDGFSQSFLSVGSSLRPNARRGPPASCCRARLLLLSHDRRDIGNAGMPPTYTCMTCHSQLWTNAQVLAPVRASLAAGKPTEWVRIDQLPDYVYFDHSIHIAKGVGCATCHGRIDRMPLTQKVASLRMKWCVDCHRDPRPNSGPAPGGVRHGLAAQRRHPAWGPAFRAVSHPPCRRAHRLLGLPPMNRHPPVCKRATG